VFVLLVIVCLPSCTNPSGRDEGLSGAEIRATAAEVPPPSLTPAPVNLILWHHWPPDQQSTVQDIVRDYQTSRPHLTVELVYQADMYGALQGVQKDEEGPDVLVLPGDRLAESVAASQLTPLEVYVDAGWLAESYLPSALDALRLDGKLWGLPFQVQTVTFIYNTSIITNEELSAQTSEIVEKARGYRSRHEDLSYLAYAARNDAYFAAPWFYGAGAWYVREDGSVGLDTPEALAAAQFLASLREIMPPGISHAEADRLFKAGQAAITVNGPWYIEELGAAGIPFGLQIMPTISTSGQPARPLVTAEGLTLGPHQRHVEEAVRLIAYLAGAESELQMARKHGLIPANRMAIERAGQEGLVIVAHFGQQAALGEPMPATPLMSAMWEPVTRLLEALWEGADPQAALDLGHRLAVESVGKSRP
jgi:maltose-binding protein MalE